MFIREHLGTLLAAALLAGCGAGEQSVSTSAPINPIGPGTTLSGSVPGVTSASVQAFHVQPSGALGEPANPLSPAPSFPLQAPSPIATGPVDPSGSFQLRLPDASPVVVRVSLNNFPLEAAVPNPGAGPVVVTPFTTIAEQLAMFSMRGGTEARTAITNANSAMAAYLGLPDLLSTSPSSSTLYASQLAGLNQQAQTLALDPQDMIGRLGFDVTDGVFDGQMSGQQLLVSSTAGNQVPLPPTLLTTGVFAKSQTPRFKADGKIAAPPADYQSPYSLKFTAPGLTDDFSQFPRSDLKEQSKNPLFADWYNLSYWKDTTNQGIISERDWGPTSNLYPAPSVPPGTTPADWKRQRVLATAYSNLKLHYQHHHIPGWNPPTNWPYWKSVAEGHITAGLDCSNFSSWNYNYGLGLKLDGAPQNQGQQTRVDNSNGTFRSSIVLAQTNPDPARNPIPYQTFKDTLQTGDLLYIRGEPGDKPGDHITHVIMWVGSPGQGSGDVPLIIDSHGPVVIDQRGVTIPNGVYLRPFYDASNKPAGTGQDWYLAAFDHAVRWIND